MMQQKIEQLKTEFDAELASISNSAGLETIKVKYLGKKGPVQDLMKSLREVSAEDRPTVGKIINDLKEHIAFRIEDILPQLIAGEDADRLKLETLDVTLPGRRRHAGRKHVINQVLDEILDILVGMGFSIQLGPDIDSDYYNFEALNFAADHPARDMQDTFYLSSDMLLRTHTSNVQVRVMEANQPPIRIIAPGKVYRNETITARSHVFFQQVEAIYIDKGVSFADLQITMTEFLSKLFHAEVETRFRPSYFPFVEPGMEVDLRCLSCQGAGCSLCKHSGWLEVAGAGMVHPNVLKHAGIDPEAYTGFAWGMGVERLVLLKHGVKDIRMFTENDLRFLQQFHSL
jgi:phenylalanyl-tRNA synthetase alpha chain